MNYDKDSIMKSQTKFIMITKRTKRKKRFFELQLQISNRFNRNNIMRSN